MQGIKYIGSREAHTDNLYGTGLIWTPGRTHNVDDAVATKMLAHADTYEHVKPTKGEMAVSAKAEIEPTPTIPLPHLEGMGKAELIAFAQQHYGEHLHPNMGEGKMRDKIMSVMQSRGR
ncbi:MAG: hypothetical protein A2143_00755 [Gallionellales bacterium RBG_16_57_15]|nr:MAG: hypothetical protein A2143_00755 [Gallionellales bacterium RBG_16_57_15]